MSCKSLVYMQIPIQGGIWMRWLMRWGRGLVSQDERSSGGTSCPQSGMGMGGGRLGKVREC